ncbi:hypothetical protein DL93DRAFT_2222690 [Clavulina sp. PMI_390]|nr:hypothetical protein DL93DRAFT_2222690 [Clavulina sp. PMI_390]
MTLTLEEQAQAILGNATWEQKTRAVQLRQYKVGEAPKRWSDRLRNDLTLVSVNFEPQLQGNKNDCVVEFSVIVEEYMCNGWDIAHGGMLTTLLDYTTSFSIPLYLTDPSWASTGLSLSLSINLLSPATRGDKLRVVVRTKAGGKRTATVACEIWGPRGLVATGNHVKMIPQVRPPSEVVVPLPPPVKL